MAALVPLMSALVLKPCFGRLSYELDRYQIDIHQSLSLTLWLILSVFSVSLCISPLLPLPISLSLAYSQCFLSLPVCLSPADRRATNWLHRSSTIYVHISHIDHNRQRSRHI